MQQKVSQIQELEQQWNSDTEKNNHKLDMLHKHLQEKGVEEKRLKNELRDSESYISILKGELMASNKAKGNIEDHVSVIKVSLIIFGIFLIIKKFFFFIHFSSKNFSRKIKGMKRKQQKQR